MRLSITVRELAKSTIHLCGYSSFYVGHLRNHYSGVVLIVYNDPYGGLLVVKITHFGEVVRLTGIDAPN